MMQKKSAKRHINIHTVLIGERGMENKRDIIIQSYRSPPILPPVVIAMVTEPPPQNVVLETIVM
jgi:hypothetical protein